MKAYLCREPGKPAWCVIRRTDDPIRQDLADKAAAIAREQGDEVELTSEKDALQRFHEENE